MSESLKSVQAISKSAWENISKRLKKPRFDFGIRMQDVPENTSGTIVSYSIKHDVNITLNKGKENEEAVVADFVEIVTSNKAMPKTSVLLEKVPFDLREVELEGGVLTHTNGYNFNIVPAA